MNILMTGGTGFIGTALCAHLLENQHRITLLSRQKQTSSSSLEMVSSLDQLNNYQHFDIVINLAGEPIMGERWSSKRKLEILNSRIKTTQKLILYFKKLKHKPSVLVSGSAIGYYGTELTDDVIDEQSAHDDSFSSRLCQQWETVALQAQTLGIRTCVLRTGIVLGAGGGALSKMLPLFKFGFGGKIGSGTQWMPWIHIDDLVGIIMHCIEQPTIRGAMNGTAPTPVRNLEFTKTLAKTLNRPALAPLPALVVKLLMGKMGEELLLSGKKVMPKKALETGYKFKFNNLFNTLDSIL